MRVEELLNTKPPAAKRDTAAVDTSPATNTSAHNILAPYTKGAEVDSAARKMRLKEFLFQYHSGATSSPEGNKPEVIRSAS